MNQHEENRQKRCAPCGRKIFFQNYNISRYCSRFLINNSMNALIKEYINANFDLNNSKFLTSICRSYHSTLLDAQNGIFTRPMPSMPQSYEAIILPRETSGVKNICNCYICSTRYKGHAKQPMGRGVKRIFNSVIEVPLGRRGN